MNELIREIEEDIRRERFDKMWKSFGKVMVSISIAVILGTIVFVVMQDRRQSNAMEKTAQLIKGIDRLNIEDYKDAITVFSSLADDPSSKYYGMAMLRKASAENALGRHDDAIKTYQQLAGSNAAFGDLAKLMLTPEAGKTIEPVLSSPFYYTQSEWKGWQLLQQGKKDEAVKQFLTIYQDAETPRSIHERMAEVLHHIAPEKLAPEIAALTTELKTEVKAK